MKRTINNRIERLMPPGAEVKPVTATFIAYIGIMIIGSLFCIANIRHAVMGLYYHVGSTGNVKMMIPDAKMPAFGELTSSSMPFCMMLIGFYAIATIVNNYRYYYRKSKSIYVMKRLNNAMELHMRAIGFPLIAVAAAFLIAILLNAVYALIYVSITPEGYAQALDFRQIISIFGTN